MSEANTVTPKPVLTKEEKIAKIEQQIKNLEQKLDDIRNDRVSVKAPKVSYNPAVGDKVLAPVGRNTATSQASIKEGTVVGVKEAVRDEEGKVTSAAQVRVQIGDGFDAQFVTLYPAQLQKVEAPADAITEDRPLGQLPE